MVLSVPVGASFTAVTLTVMVLGEASRSMPPLAVPPLSCTWKVKLARAAPFALSAGVNWSKPDVMFATGMEAPAVTATELFVRLPLAGSVVTFTPSSVFAGVSVGSVRPKSAAANV